MPPNRPWPLKSVGPVHRFPRRSSPAATTHQHYRTERVGRQRVRFATPEISADLALVSNQNNLEGVVASADRYRPQYLIQRAIPIRHALSQKCTMLTKQRQPSTRLDPNGLCLEFMNMSRRYGMSVVPAGAFLAARTVAATRFKRSPRPSASTTSGRCASNCAPPSNALHRAAGQFTENDYQQ
jgi:hypothetical protein